MRTASVGVSPWAVLAASPPRTVASATGAKLTATSCCVLMERGIWYLHHDMARLSRSGGVLGQEHTELMIQPTFLM